MSGDVNFMCCEHCMFMGVYDDPEFHEKYGIDAHDGECPERGCWQGSQKVKASKPHPACTAGSCGC